MNPLYPIFLKLHQLRLLIVGAGEVGTEKLHFILKSSPDAQITVVATWMSDTFLEILAKYPNHKVTYIKRAFQTSDVDRHHLVIAATDINEVNRAVHQAAQIQGKPVNVADTPDLCDFYLGSIVTRGDLKVAISTNGKSPTFAKRFRQVLEEVLPHNTHDLLTNLKVIRDKLTGNFTEKVKALNDITASLVE